MGPIGPVPLMVGDAVYVFFSPPLSKIVVSVSSSKMGPYRQVTNMNETITSVPVQIGTQGSYVQFVPQSDGYFSLVLNVTSQQPFNMLLGVLTNDYTNFEPYRIFTVERAYFVEIVTMRNVKASNWSISFEFIVKQKGEESWFIIPIPSSAGIILLGAAILCLAYPNAFLITGLYFKSKKEEVSTKRKVGVFLSLLISLLLIYWLYLRVTV
ncbi:MAG: hypothetical protein ACUVTL_01830 [Thermoproteota archaeon]